MKDIVFVSIGPFCAATEEHFIGLKAEHPAIKRIHGVCEEEGVRAICAEIVDTKEYEIIRSAEFAQTATSHKDRSSLDIVYLTYAEPNAEQNFQELLQKYLGLKRLHGVKGLTRAFRVAAFLVESSHFVLIDGDNKVLPTFDLTKAEIPQQEDTIHLYMAKNPINGLVYGYGGVKVCPVKNFLNISDNRVDPIASGNIREIKPIFTVASVTAFNVSPYDAWKAGFREAAMLSAQDPELVMPEEELRQRLETWKTVGVDQTFGRFAIAGAYAGEAYGRSYKQDLPSLNKINDPDWLKGVFNEKKPRLRLCSVWGESLDMLPHFIHHYNQLGVENFHLILHARSENSDLEKSMRVMLNSQNITLEETYVGPWSAKVVTDRINAVKRQYPKDWFIIADSDELQVYPDDVESVIRNAETAGKDFVTGCLIDRISSTGQLVPIQASSIWEQFPLAGFISFPLSRANPYKITLCKGHVELSEGQHGVVVPDQDYPVTNEVISQVHHFKWTRGLLERLSSRLLFRDAGEWRGAYMGYGDEIECAVNYMRKNRNGLNTDEPLFLLQKTDGAFSSYEKWNDVKEIVRSWPALHEYPGVDAVVRKQSTAMNLGNPEPR